MHELLNKPGPRFATAVPKCPITYRRPPSWQADKIIESSGVAHANRAPSTDHPEGSVEYSETYKDYTVLQQHVLFWDRDNDGFITPIDVWVGFRDLGFNIPICLLAATVIPFAFSYGTIMQYSYLPDPFFRLFVGGMHKAKHGSDSGIYDTEGRFMPQKFEDAFTNCSARNDDTLTLGEIFGLMSRNRCAVDPFGRKTAKCTKKTFGEYTMAHCSGRSERNGAQEKDGTKVGGLEETDLLAIIEGSMLTAQLNQNQREMFSPVRGTRPLINLAQPFSVPPYPVLISPRKV
ncbi:hypothetical protein CkaCkLH20_10646 [Colletotrichum karsti]|uniref:Peroxygenase 3 n=1 Tax=Colletotrichum karsti TaxID=1095194 RepID=A0A9P6HWW7_9PEZI|nr:uncharacterized protein CkaCkLH20_10646 [Colletotrichum karsti]KAF9872014.1 hypothetical protein CkaCkLH20_10646 [Colletotrichum karsti]